MNFHLVGMGVIGSVIAWRLQREGMEFTWNDENHPFTAWKACTGSVLPSKDALDQEGYEAWSGYLMNPPYGFPPVVEAGCYIYNHLNPPEGAKCKQTNLGAFRMAAIASYHVNAQMFVQETRRIFSKQRQVVPSPGFCELVTHGSSHLLKHYVWGWHALANIKTPWDETISNRPCLYFRQNRFRLTYAFPKPGTPYHYIGSDMIAQKNPHSLNVGRRLIAWQENFEKTAGPGFKVRISTESIIEGWRPTPHDQVSLLSQSEGKLFVRPLGHSGVRWSPSVARSVVNFARSESFSLRLG